MHKDSTGVRQDEILNDEGRSDPSSVIPTRRLWLQQSCPERTRFVDIARGGLVLNEGSIPLARIEDADDGIVVFELGPDGRVYVKEELVLASFGLGDEFLTHEGYRCVLRSEAGSPTWARTKSPLEIGGSVQQGGIVASPMGSAPASHDRRFYVRRLASKWTGVHIPERSDFLLLGRSTRRLYRLGPVGRTKTIQFAVGASGTGPKSGDPHDAPASTVRTVAIFAGSTPTPLRGCQAEQGPSLQRGDAVRDEAAIHRELTQQANDDTGNSTAMGRTRPVDPEVCGAAIVGGKLLPVQPTLGKYDGIRKLGEGAMGDVCLVRHRELGVERALKLINLTRFPDPEMRARARREARAMALFSHTNAVTVHDANADGDLAYIEMEYIRGRSLNRVLQPGVPMSIEWVAEFAQQVCAVLEVAHAHGIVHRDLKPSNMMLVGDEPQTPEHLKILDFGVSKILYAEEQEGDDFRTWSGALIGTPAYMSPEQIDTDVGKLDGRSDLYSVGVILFEMLTGRRPFVSASFRLTYDHLYTSPPTFAEVNPKLNVPADVEDLVLRCLEKDPNSRPSSARELAEAFKAAMPRSTGRRHRRTQVRSPKTLRLRRRCPRA